MKKRLTIWPFIFVSFFAIAQKPPIKFGDVAMDVLKMQVYDKDTSAGAVVLADYGESTITYNQNQGFELRFERLRRIKILNKSDYDWANFVIPVYKTDANDEKLTNLKAATFNLEGGKITETRLTKEGIFNEKATDNWANTRITLPNVKEGSVIDIAYSISSPFLFNFQDWEFQSAIPVLWSEYVAKIPEYFDYQKYTQGYIPLAVNDQWSEQKTITLNFKQRTQSFTSATSTSFSAERINYNEISYRWVSKDVPAFKEEPYMTNSVDYLSKINFELALIAIPGQPVQTVMGTWENINKELLESNQFGGAIKKSGSLSKIVQEITAGKNSAENKISAIYHYVKGNVEWDGNYRKFTEGNFKKVLEEKKGNSADINLMMVAMLQKAGIQADPLVVSTRNHGFVRPQFPLSSQFNYVLCAAQINNDILLLDATDRTLPMNALPERCLNGQGLLISEKQSGWIELVPSFRTRSLTDASLEFDEQGKMKCQLKVTKEGYHGQQMRIQYLTKGEGAYLKALNEQNDWVINESKFENITNLNDPVYEIYDMSLSDENALAEIIYINPLVGHRETQNPFKSETREYPVDFGSGFEKVHLTNIKIPDGYQIEDLPENIAITLPNKGGRFIYNVGRIGNTIRLTSQLVIGKGLFTQDEYAALREFYAKVVAKQEEQFVLKKKE